MAYNIPEPQLVYLTTVSPSAVGNIDITTGFTSKYTTYLMKLRNMTVSNNSIILRMKFSTDGGSSYSTTNYSSVQIFDGTSLDDNTSTSFGYVEGDESNTSTILQNIDVLLFNVSNAQMKSAYTYSGGFQAFSNIMSTRNMATINTVTTAVNAIRVETSAGTMTGKIYLYGVNE